MFDGVLNWDYRLSIPAKAGETECGSVCIQNSGDATTGPCPPDFTSPDPAPAFRRMPAFPQRAALFFLSSAFPTHVALRILLLMNQTDCIELFRRLLDVRHTP